MINTQKKCCLAIDLENDCGGRIGLSFDNISDQNLDRLVNFVIHNNLPLTVFVTGKILEEKPEVISRFSDKLGDQVEFELHAYEHKLGSINYINEITKGVAAYRNHFKQNPIGFRAPQGKISDDDFHCLNKNSFRFDSSIFPTYRPGVFSNLKHTNTPIFLEKYNLWEIPNTVFRFLKIPLGLGYLRLIGNYLSDLLISLLINDEFAVLNFHLHDVESVEHVNKLDWKARCFYSYNVGNGYRILKTSVNRLKMKGYQFVLMKDYLDDIG